MLGPCSCLLLDQFSSHSSPSLAIWKDFPLPSKTRGKWCYLIPHSFYFECPGFSYSTKAYLQNYCHKIISGIFIFNYLIPINLIKTFFICSFWVDFSVLCKIRVCYYSFACVYPLFPAPFVGDIVLSALCSLDPLVEDKISYIRMGFLLSSKLCYIVCLYVKGNSLGRIFFFTSSHLRQNFLS